MSTYINYFAQQCRQHFPWSDVSNLRTLVVGCGKGLDCAEFTDFQEIHGLDLCQNLGRDFSHPKVTYFHESAEAINRPSNYYDLVFSVATLEHIHDLPAAFGEIYRVSKPGGLIYTLAEPLWNSLEGHHLNYLELFIEFPWIHLRLSARELRDYICTNKTISQLQGWLDILEAEGLLAVPVLANDIVSYADNIIAFLSSDYFNHLPAYLYVEAADKIPVNQVICNQFWQDGEKLLTRDILEELESKGLTKDELLSVSHTYVAIK
jgi:SAM-dependent methyltransferase